MKYLFHIIGCLLTKKNLTTVLKLFILREKGIDWEKYAGYFHIDYSELADESLTAVDKVSKISELWYQKEPFPLWWELSDILHMCCDYCPEDIRFVMMDIHEHIVNGKERLLTVFCLIKQMHDSCSIAMLN